MTTKNVTIYESSDDLDSIIEEAVLDQTNITETEIIYLPFDVEKIDAQQLKGSKLVVIENIMNQPMKAIIEKIDDGFHYDGDILFRVTDSKHIRRSPEWIDIKPYVTTLTEGVYAYRL
ncbi:MULTISPECIES: hypothetical protein [Latilactobacillus]|uniref:Uncharacterized protein n=1 Tax=Latilactobacillus curvatus TaxID=28038 RepID=A0ABM7QWG3_LATCU|nr:MULTISPECIES: hypothetical protein [Latilactobacillus]ASN13583.1 hypothetical protein B4V05_10145 [Latilactobacillus sakei]KGB13919.1 hypothetical protein KY41_10370 [Latilactobacillus sakei]MCW8780340.1 hypothetical protein [Latilactobacillus curvatus]UTB73295.1 hypothetical protein A4W72_11090 [Latilactobacillus curvatus]BCX31529.1 hypothetical protein LTWDN19_20960 [Latilactobacillus curvatus]